MQKILFKIQRIMPLFLMITGVMFLLQSCCCIRGITTSSKVCDCGKQNLAKKSRKSEKKETVNQPTVVTETTSPSVKTNDPVTEQTTDASVSGMMTNVVNATPASTTPAPVIITEYAVVQKKPGALIKMKKLPLGIKGMNTHVIAGPSMSFKSSKEDYGNTNHKHKPGLGFQLGVSSSFTFSEQFGVSSALILKQNKASEVLSYPSTSEPGGGTISQETETKYSYTYLSVPVRAEVKVTDNLTVMAGPEVNLLLGASAKSEGGYPNSGKTDLKDKSVKTGVGVQAGIKYEIPGSPIAVQLVYDHRLSRLNEKTESSYYPGGSYEIPAWNMKSIQLAVTCSICQLLQKMMQ